ncbi:hypothetical protein D3C72_2358330 [compost metagenome]
MHTGTTDTGQSPSGQKSLSGSVQAWSTSISWQVVTSNSCSTSVLMRCHDKSTSPGKGGSVGMPQPSSALLYCAAAPTANVGILSRKKFRPWSL